MMVEPNPDRPLRVAIIGAGPGGLGAAIALSALPNVQLTIYERARELRAIGGGIRIGYNAWRVLELLGADADVKGHVRLEVQYRNGLKGTLLARTHPDTSLPAKYLPQRVRRSRLQSALLKQVPPGTIQLNKRLEALENLPGDEGVRLFFGDGTEVTADLVVGADGIRSVVREHAFPDHKIQFTGTTNWRALIPRTFVSHLSEHCTATSWWFGRTGYAYFSPVDDPSELAAEDQMFDITVQHHINPATDTEKRVSWGIPATNERVNMYFKDYDHIVREILSKVPEGGWKEFAAFSGSRLETLTAWDKLVLVGDASHPLNGAFGSGAAFALEDGWILARAIEYAFSKDARSSQFRQQPLREALSIFNSIRSPYYLRMYQCLDNQRQKMIAAKAVARSFEDIMQTQMPFVNESGELSWIYFNDIEDVWQTWLDRNDRTSRTQMDDGGMSISAQL